MEKVWKEEYTTTYPGKLEDWLQLSRKPKVPSQWNVSGKLPKLFPPNSQPWSGNNVEKPFLTILENTSFPGKFPVKMNHFLEFPATF
jgi:hypothetical protein